MRNTYDLLTDVRDNVKESSEKRWGDNDILRKINQSFRMRCMELAQVRGDWLLTSSDLTPSSGVITLPSNCTKVIYMENTANGYEIPVNATVRERNLTRNPLSSIYTGCTDAYLHGNTIVVNQASYSEGVTLWYQKRLPDLITGTGDTGTASAALVFAAAMEPHLVDDYYNDVTIEVVSGTDAGRRTTISDYVGSTRTATLAAGALDTTSVYGTVSDLPEEADALIVLDATLICMASPGAAVDPQYFQFFAQLRREAKRAWDGWIAERLVASNRIRVTEIE